MPQDYSSDIALETFRIVGYSPTYAAVKFTPSVTEVQHEEGTVYLRPTTAFFNENGFLQGINDEVFTGYGRDTFGGYADVFVGYSGDTFTGYADVFAGYSNDVFTGYRDVFGGYVDVFAGYWSNTTYGVELVASDPKFVLAQPLTYRVDFLQKNWTITQTYGLQKYRRRNLDPVPIEPAPEFRSFKFIAPQPDSWVDIKIVPRYHIDAPIYPLPAIITEQDPVEGEAS